MQSDKLISIIGVNYLHPITILIEARSALKTAEPNEVQASRWDNGIAVSLIILTVLMVESIINRIQYILKIIPPVKTLDFIKTTEWTKSCFEKLQEIFVLRDVIAHNHIWEAEFYWDVDYDMKLIDALLVDGYGDKKFSSVLNAETRKTHLLGLNLFPVRINWSDYKIVLKEVLNFLEVIEKQDANYFRISNEFVKYKNYVTKFTDVANSILGESQ